MQSLAQRNPSLAQRQAVIGINPTVSQVCAKKDNGNIYHLQHGNVLEGTYADRVPLIAGLMVEQSRWYHLPACIVSTYVCCNQVLPLSRRPG